MKRLSTHTHTHTHTTVARGFDADGVAEKDSMSKAKRRKLTKLEDTYSCYDDLSALRQRAWLAEGGADTDASSWRPVKQQRCATKKCFMRLDVQCMTMTGNGLGFFQYNAELPQWAHWKTWPSVGLASDCGSDMLCMQFAAEYLFDLNWWRWLDPSHVDKSVFEGALKDANLYEFTLLQLVSFNLEYGPFQDETRRGDIAAAMQSVYSKKCPAQVPLFLAYAPRMVKALERYGIVVFPRVRNIEDELWDFLKFRSRKPAATRRVAMSRFGACYYAHKACRPWWWVDVWERTYYCLESDMLSGKAFKEKLSAKMLADDPANPASANGSASTSAKRLQVDDRALRKCQMNGATVSVMNQSDAFHEMIVGVIVVAGRPADDHHCYQVVKLRSVLDTEEWLIEQINGGFMNHVCKFIRNLTSRSSLDEIGLSMPPPDMFGEALETSIETLDLEIAIEDDVADMFGQLSISFVGQHVSRMLFLFEGWPHRALGMLGNSEQADAHLEAYRKDKAIFDSLCALPNRTKGEDFLLQRHPMQTRAAKHLEACLHDSGYACTKEVKDDFLRPHARTLIQSHIIEDLNGIAKNDSQLKACRRFRRPERQMAKCIEADVVSNRHRFENVSVDAPSDVSETKLPKAAFDLASDSTSMDFSAVQGTTSPNWWSPSCANMSCSQADAHMYRELARVQTLRAMEQAWLGRAFTRKCKLAISVPRPGVLFQRDWFLAVHPFNKSSVLLWPMTLQQALPHDPKVANLAEDVSEPVMKPITSLALKDVQVQQLKWRSWLWQCRFIPKAACHLEPGVRYFAFGVPEAFVFVACKSAWWLMSRTDIADYANELKTPIPDESDLFESLWHLNETHLKSTPDDNLKIIGQRISNHCSDQGVSEALLEIDDCMELFDHYDVQVVHTTQSQAVERLSSNGRFNRPIVVRPRS